jgi:hypothetical protein
VDEFFECARESFHLIGTCRRQPDQTIGIRAPQFISTMSLSGLIIPVIRKKNTGAPRSAPATPADLSTKWGLSVNMLWSGAGEGWNCFMSGIRYTEP